MPRKTRERDSKKDRPRTFKFKKQKRKVCAFCTDKTMTTDYKDAGRLRRFMTERGKILPRRITGTCTRHQRKLTVGIKRARAIALLPFTT